MKNVSIESNSFNENSQASLVVMDEEVVLDITRELSHSYIHLGLCGYSGVAAL